VKRRTECVEVRTSSRHRPRRLPSANSTAAPLRPQLSAVRSCHVRPTSAHRCQTRVGGVNASPYVRGERRGRRWEHLTRGDSWCVRAVVSSVLATDRCVFCPAVPGVKRAVRTTRRVTAPSPTAVIWSRSGAAEIRSRSVASANLARSAAATGFALLSPRLDGLARLGDWATHGEVTVQRGGTRDDGRGAVSRGTCLWRLRTSFTA
jgi:hypothetical protein